MEPPRPLPSRARRWQELEGRPCDVLVVGGGITGAGIALDLAARGVRTALVERGDWGSGTSSASSRLIHGGLRYLEQLEFGLVRDSCLERGLLLENAAGLVWPETFVFPVHRGGPVGRVRLAAGLALYTLVSVPRRLGWPRMLSARSVSARVPGIRAADLLGGGSYLDGATHDARLTLAVVLSAIDRGAIALSHVEALAIENGRSSACVRLRDGLTGEERVQEARAVVLAGGPFTDALRARANLARGWLRPTRGTHGLVRRERLPTDGAVIFPSPVDGRVMFLIPWPRYTVIGTTDLDAAPEEPVRATAGEVRYLLESANRLVPGAELGPEDVLSAWAGLRPLLAAAPSAHSGRAREERPSERSREERIEREGSIYTIAGGKLTTFRSMAERLCARLTSELGVGRSERRSPTRTLRLRGALARAVERPAWSALDERGRARSRSEPLLEAWRRRYAALVPLVDEFCQRAEQGRSALDPETLLGEVDWAVRHEDCLRAQDFFLRRTDIGYAGSHAARASFEPVLERLAGLLSWNAERSREEREDLRRAVEGLQAWREAPAPARAPLAPSQATAGPRSEGPGDLRLGNPFQDPIG